MNVLLIEDNYDLRESLQVLLELELHPTTIAESRDDALTLFAKNPKSFDWIISDYMMPGLEMPPFVDEVRKLRPDIPIAVYSASMDLVDDIKKGLPKEGIYYLKKPGLDGLWELLKSPRPFA